MSLKGGRRFQIVNPAALMLETSMAIEAVNKERADKLWNSTGLDRRHLGFCTKEREGRIKGECSPAENFKVICWIGLALPDTLILGLHPHGEWDDHPAALEVDWLAASVGDVAQHQNLNGVVRETCFAPK